MKTYRIRAVRWERGWELHIDGVGVTQTVKLSGAANTVRDYLKLDGCQDADTAALAFVYAGDGVDERVAAFVRAREAAAVAERAALEASRQARQAVHDLVSVVGLSGQEAAKVLGVSPQRVSQLLGSFDAGLKADPRRGVHAKAATPARGQVKKAVPVKAADRSALSKGRREKN